MNRFLVMSAAACLAAGTAFAQTGTPFTPDSLTRALWHFNESSGSLVADTTWVNDGIAYGTAIVAGRFGNARWFNGSGDNVNVPASTAFDFDTSGFSVDVWFKTTQPSGVIIRRGLAPEPGFMISTLNGHVVGMIGNRSDLPWPNALLSDTSTGTYNDNAWHLATLVRDRVLRKVLLYVDGVKEGRPADDNFTIPLNSSRPLTIGCWEYVPYASYFAGSIDEVRISGRNSDRPPVAISVQPALLDFGWVQAHSNDTLSLQIRNPGYRDSLRVTLMSPWSPLFGVSPGAIVIPPFGSGTVKVWYAPGAGKVIGDTSAILITSNDPLLPQIRIWTYGFGFIPNPPTAPFSADSYTRALWHFDEVSGAVVHDSALSNDGLAAGTTIIPGRFGNGRSFNGTSDYVSIPSSAAFDFDSSGFSIDVWFRTAQPNGVILRRGLAPDPGFMISLLNGHVVGMIGNRSDLPWPNALMSDTSVATYADNAWHCVTFTRSLSANRLLLYVDGVMASQPAIGWFSLPLSGNHPLTIGRWENNDYPSYFAGAIDEIRITGSNTVRWPVRITVQPARLDFGRIRISSRDTLGIQVTNAGYRDSLQIGSITSSNTHFSVPGGPTALGPGAQRTFHVLYVPTGSHADTGTVTIASNDPSNPSMHIVVTGQGYAISDTPSISSIAYLAYNQARIVWTRSAFDTVGAADPVTDYSAWHRVTGSGSGSQSKSPAANTSLPEDTPGPTWEFIQSVPAIGLDVYSLAVQVPVTTTGAGSWQVYIVVARTRNLATFMSAPDSIRGIAVTGINGSGEDQAPAEVTLKQNYPNPFNPSTLIRFGLPAKAAVSLVVYNALGQAVATLVDGELGTGYHEVRFDGASLASGVYFCRLKAGLSVRTNKILLLR